MIALMALSRREAWKQPNFTKAVQNPYVEPLPVAAVAIQKTVKKSYKPSDDWKQQFTASFQAVRQVSQF
jgi:hypothetical protein